MPDASAKSDSKPKATALPKRRRRWKLGLFIVLVVVGAGAWLAINRPWAPKPAVVEVQQVVLGPASRVLAVNGTLASGTEITMHSTVPGQLEAVTVSAGEAVQQGQTLAILDGQQQRAIVEQANAQLQSSLAQEKQAESNLKRANGLNGTISRQDIESAQVAAATASNDVQRYRGALQQAQSLLNAYTIKAPFAGTILSRDVDPGQVVDASTTLFELADLDQLRVEASVDELYAGQIHPGLEVRLQPSGSDRTFNSTVSFVSPMVDSTTGGRTVRISIAKAHPTDLAIGQTVTTNIVVDQRPKAITVPRSAIVDSRTAPAVFVIVDGKAERRMIAFIDWPADRLIVTSGLKAGDRVVTTPDGVIEGELVKAKGADT